ncbi:SagB family peptide dehydrogenase [Oenococcus kitaharae]|uniref:Amino acid adenylation n=1 Tax=Oenococcus kitaharae DSM 17330 TaxID=1045004 RepID=G9WIH8_9LACO|nr:SagB family peptide dehydrogenase [Oenococcus kitaharae]EHN58990.1 Amino acid adenylation [Oenococcus kitaharae DSM 17330]OEY81703.1 hypothetical protein NT96_07930 [Oenococcus kitaharae]OEY83934.1 hypothetical protein NT95_01990 [Oenococcus kitaharae]OEY85710.1 hypothetical protein NV75_04445 [Oenococcus kitaharae]
MVDKKVIPIKIRGAHSFLSEDNVISADKLKLLSEPDINKYKSRFFEINKLQDFMLNLPDSFDNLEFLSNVERLSTQSSADVMETLYLEESTDEQVISLPDIKTVGIKENIFDILNRRESKRNFSSAVVPLIKLSAFLKFSMGINSETINNKSEKYFLHRTYASAGALYPVSLYLFLKKVQSVPTGFYKYQPFHNSLLPVNLENNEQSNLMSLMNFSIQKIPVFGFLVWDIRKNFFKYGERSLLFSLIETGEINQNMDLISSALDLGFCQIGGYKKHLVSSNIKLDEMSEHLVASFVLGCI